MPMFSKSTGISVPCLKCNATELKTLHDHFKASKDDFWVYKCVAVNCCNRCDTHKRELWRSYPYLRSCLCVDPHEFAQVPIPIGTVGTIERAVHASSIASKGSEFRAHGTFISHLQLLDASEIMKQSLCAWAPSAMIDFNAGVYGTQRILRKGQLCEVSSAPEQVASTPPGLDAIEPLISQPPNDDCVEGAMIGTNVASNAYGEEDRVTGVTYQVEPKVLAHQIGPDLIPTEVMESTESNLKAGLAKRVKPLGFKSGKDDIRKIEKTVNMLMTEVFSVSNVKNWREQNPDIDEFKSSKWDSARWAQAVDEALSDVNAQIEQTFQIKTNEALPAKGKAPRPIIQCGDRAQVMMNLVVKCFEDLLFHYFEEASIKHIDKLGAMKRVSMHLRQRGANLIEGDGSAWDSCCNPTIRKMTENRIIRHIILALGDDPQVPRTWMDKTLADMDKKYLKGKAKVSDFSVTPLKVMIESIRQSGHRGTSCFNYLINLIGWLVVLCENPEKMVKKSKNGELKCDYCSARDKKTYRLKYAFEGDDSAISTTENLVAYADDIEDRWKKMGFRMKLVYVNRKMTFTGYDFLVDKDGPTGVMIPEIARNVASSSWTCSSLVKSHPHKKHEVGMAAMLARATNFQECGAFSKYFASLGLAHAQKCGDMALGEDDAKKLGIHVSPSVLTDLQELYDNADVMSDDMRELVRLIIPFSHEQELRMLQVDFGSNPYDLSVARMTIPFTVWDPANFHSPRR